MARKSIDLPHKQLTRAEQESAVARLEARIKEIGELDTSSIQTGNDPGIQEIQARTRSTLAAIFGEGSPAYMRLGPAAKLDATQYVLRLDGRRAPPQDIRDGVERGKKRAIALLRGEADSIRENLKYAADVAADPKSVRSATTPTNNQIFIVHGRDNLAETEVANVVERAGLVAVILHRQPNEGRTIIEKFEDHGGAASFAIIVLTPDDLGGIDAHHLQPRARQNVIGEMFWFAGKLGRDRVCALMKDTIELPSDFAGVGYTEMDDRGAWKSKLLRELSAAGFKVNWEQALP
jgi:predicted nucleotide-binding protein